MATKMNWDYIRLRGKEPVPITVYSTYVSAGVFRIAYALDKTTTPAQAYSSSLVGTVRNCVSHKLAFDRVYNYVKQKMLTVEPSQHHNTLPGSVSETAPETKSAAPEIQIALISAAIPTDFHPDRPLPERVRLLTLLLTSNEGYIQELEQLADKAFVWFSMKKPVGWTVQHHCEQHQVNCFTESDKGLAKQVASILSRVDNEGLDHYSDIVAAG